jgi:excisionase family DNA binding protein
MDAPSAKTFLTREELSARTGLSVSTIHRLKRAHLIPFYQPGGKGSRVLFPPNAIEVANRANPDDISTVSQEATVPSEPVLPKRLPGPRPRWRAETQIA